MTFNGVMEKVKAILILLYERPWERSELLTIAAGLFVFLLFLVARRRRKAMGRITYAEHAPKATTAIGTKLAGPNQSGNRVKKLRKGNPAHANKAQGNRRKWSTVAERPGSSDDPARQLRLQREIVKHNQTKARLEHEVVGLKIAGEQVRQESVQSRQVEERLKRPVTEATVVEEQLQRELAESKQTEENLKRKLGELVVANEQLRQEVTESRQAEERFKLKVGELTIAYEQLRQKTTESQKAGPGGRSSGHEDYHRVVDGAEQKLCRKCDEWKARSEFHKNASSKDGLATWCKVCKTRAARESRQRRAAPKD